MSTTNATTNFYLLLQLDPDAPWNEADFELRVQTKRKEWSRKSSGVGRTALEAKKSMEQLKGADAFKSNPVERERQAQEARLERVSAKKAEQAQLRESLEFTFARGYIVQSELDTLIKEAKTLTEKEIRDLLTVPVVPKAPAPTANVGTKVQPLEESQLKKINEQLQMLGMETLYQVLGLDQTVSEDKLLQAATALYNDMVRRGTSMDVGAKKDLAGQAKSIFSSPDKRCSYDESIRLRSLEAILKQLSDSMIRSGEKTMTLGQTEVFLKKTREAGWADEVALERLREMAQRRNWFVQVPPLDIQAKKLVRCGHCNSMNEPGSKFCAHCHTELLTSCPNCGADVRPDAIGCNSCGFATGNRFYVDELLAKFPFERDYVEAGRLLDEVAALWSPAKPDARVQKLQEYRTTLQHRAKEQQTIQQQLDQLLEQKHLFKAQEFLAAKREKISNPQHYQQRISDTIAQARNLLNKAQGVQDRETKSNLYRTALQLCSDYREARELLKALPPVPASQLQASVSGTLVSLSWQHSPTQGVNYKIVRQAHSQPTGLTDGELLATVNANSYDDTRSEIGVPLYYAIFTGYEDVTAPQPTLLNKPIFLLQDVQNEASEVHNNQVILKWTPPPNVRNVVIVRKEGLAPRSIDDGLRLTTSASTSLVDRDILNEHTYYYGIYSQFNNQGKTLISAGKVVKARPEAPPAVINELTISNEKLAQGYRVQLTWPQPDKGKVIILKSEQSTQLSAGESISIDQLKNYGQVLQGQAQLLIDTWLQQGICYYTPVVTFGGIAYIGTEIPCACIDEVTNLRSENLGNTIRLQWTWPASCWEVAISYNHDGWQYPPVKTHYLTKAEYEHTGYFDLREDRPQECYIRVATLIRQGKQRIQAPGIRLQARLAPKITLTYEIRKARFSKKRTLYIHTHTPGLLPALVLICRRERLPLQKSEGERLWHQGPTHIEKELNLPLPEQKYQPRTFGKLYLEDSNAYNFVTIQHPNDTKLRLD
ncbi:zinc ribbon domain-containing protein [Dictyobacter formicarum]|uniref:Transcriptional regulator n=1 Tax=Dictyobacter formicarum TaxID=2778368 RepID=A0ABQ3VKL9_9CHLR|nr:zinc ribbon domain-containing protein [Dictyobacter formicarum]GHO86340.1 transcriptional regulator [Dictyobacter formicarum]